jgi:Mce-associated membrane protein
MSPSQMSPSLYDLLDVDGDASDTEIRAAWRSAIADLDPSDRRFRAYNQAAEVLLDPSRRAAYDAELAGRETPEESAAVSAAAAPTAAVADHGPPPSAAPASGEGRIPSLIADLKRRLARPRRPRPEVTTPSAEVTSRPVPVWLLVGLAVAVVGLVVAVVYFANQPSDTEVEESTRAAQSAAEQAVVPILSYDAKTLEEDQAAAQARMTSDYREEYDKLFEAIKENAPRTRTSVSAEVIASGIVRSGEDRVEILVFVDRPTTNKAQKEPVIYRDQVTVTMQRVGGDWLVDDLETSPVAP